MFHTSKSFLKCGWREPSTYLGVGSIFLVFYFWTDIALLIHNYLTSDKLLLVLVESTPLIISSLLVWMKEKQHNDTC